MTGFDEYVRRIVSRARVARSSVRDDLQRELHSHFEDAMEEARAGTSETGSLADNVLRRFGDPEEIGDHLERVHRFERRAILTVDGLLLMGASVLAVAMVVLSLQLSIALSRGIPPAHAFPRFRGEAVAFVSLALGYMSLYLEEWALKRFRLLPAFILNLCVFVWLFTLASPVLHLRTIAPGTSFVAGALVRLLQRTSLRSVWYLGSVVPTVAAVLTGGPLLSTGSETPLWWSILFRCIGQSAACYFLTLLAQIHQRRRPAF